MAKKRKTSKKKKKTKKEQSFKEAKDDCDEKGGQCDLVPETECSSCDLNAIVVVRSADMSISWCHQRAPARTSKAVEPGEPRPPWDQIV